MAIKRAFLVGINYTDTQSELRGCINDVLAIRDVLITHYQYLPDNILLLSDETSFKPTRDNILKGFEWLLSKSSASDFEADHYLPTVETDIINLFFHYSGHGSQVLDRSSDEADGYDETICPLDFATAGMVTDDEIRARLAMKVPSKSKLIAIVDACHSQSSFDLLWECKPSFFGGYSLKQIGKYAPTPGTVIMLSGCRDNQTSADIVISGKGQGALTYSLLQVLRTSNYQITYDRLLTEVGNYIKQNRLSAQVPCLTFGKSVKISSGFCP